MDGSHIAILIFLLAVSVLLMLFVGFVMLRRCRRKGSPSSVDADDVFTGGVSSEKLATVESQQRRGRISFREFMSRSGARKKSVFDWDDDDNGHMTAVNIGTAGGAAVPQLPHLAYTHRRMHSYDLNTSAPYIMPIGHFHGSFSAPGSPLETNPLNAVSIPVRPYPGVGGSANSSRKSSRQLGMAPTIAISDRSSRTISVGSPAAAGKDRKQSRVSILFGLPKPDTSPFQPRFSSLFTPNANEVAGGGQRPSVCESMHSASDAGWTEVGSGLPAATKSSSLRSRPINETVVSIRNPSRPPSVILEDDEDLIDAESLHHVITNTIGRSTDPAVDFSGSQKSSATWTTTPEYSISRP